MNFSCSVYQKSKSCATKIKDFSSSVSKDEAMWLAFISISRAQLYFTEPALAHYNPNSYQAYRDKLDQDCPKGIEPFVQYDFAKLHDL